MVSILKGEGVCMTTFKNFKIKGWTASIQNYAFNHTRFESLLYKALELCFFQLHPNGGSLTKLPTTKKLQELEIKINDLAQFGFHNSKTMSLALQMSEALGGYAIGFDDLPIREWALHGKQILNSTELKESQIIAFSVLKEIDDALSSLSDITNLNFHSIEKVIGISLAIQTAYEIEYNCYNPATINSDAAVQAYLEEYRAAKSNHGLNMVKIKLENDPKQKEKEFIFDCWNDWRQGKRVYKNQTAFINDMLEKNEFLKNFKVIEGWCTGWNKGTSK